MALNIQIKLTRDSVCMGDDIEDHTKIINIALQYDTSNAIMSIAKSYLPYVAGRGHTWDCYLNSEKIAIINGNCTKITPLINALVFVNDNGLYFKYHSATY